MFTSMKYGDATLPAAKVAVITAEFCLFIIDSITLALFVYSFTVPKAVGSVSIIVV
jgi:hypothetical protein